MAKQDDSQNSTGLIGWIDERFPLSSFIKNHLTEYYAPKSFNFWYLFGALALFVFVMQLLTGIFLTMHYKPDAAQAFASVEYIMRDVSFGWLIRSPIGCPIGPFSRSCKVPRAGPSFSQFCEVHLVQDRKSVV